MLLSWRAPLTTAAIALAGCHLAGGLSGLEYVDDAGAAGGTTTTGGTGATGATGATGGTGGIGGMGGTGTAGGGDGGTATGGAPALDDSGLIVRYFIDEADSGTVAELQDSAPSPLPLSIVASSVMSFTEIGGNRGLTWNAIGLDDRASVAIDGTKIHQRLQGSTTATIELVLDLREATTSASRISHIGWDTENGRLTLRTRDAQLILFHVSDGVPVGEFPVDLAGSGRVVIHAVVDTDLTTPSDRARLYVDAAPVAATGGTPQALGATIDLSTGRHYVLGNREIGGRSFVGEMFYAALYDEALDPGTIANNTAALQLSDDHP